MKITKLCCQRITLATIIMTVTALASLPGSARAEDTMKPMKPAEHLLMLNNPVTTKEQADALTNSDSMAMVCAKCKTVYITRVKQGVKGAELLTSDGPPTELIGTHGCPGCHSTMTVIGVPRAGHIELKHTCAMCGDDSGFCCAIKSSEGATKGMEDNK